MEKLKCQRCNHKWLPRVEGAKECPNCKSRLWNKPLTFGEILSKAMKKTKEKKNEESSQN